MFERKENGSIDLGDQHKDYLTWLEFQFGRGIFMTHRLTFLTQGRPKKEQILEQGIWYHLTIK